jgi:hypothetical protein
VTGEDRQPFLGVVLTYPEVPDRSACARSELRNAPVRSGQVGVGFVGAGNFAKSVLLPRFKGRRARAGRRLHGDGDEREDDRREVRLRVLHHRHRSCSATRASTPW